MPVNTLLLAADLIEQREVSMGRRPVKLPLRDVPGAKRTSTSSPGRSTGSMRSRTASSNWKMAVLAPMPSASEMIAAAAKPLSRSSSRTA